MDQLSKKLFEELEEMQQQAGRMLRNMSFVRMLPFEACGYRPSVNIYETESEICAYFDLAGADSDTLTVVADSNKVRVSGTRELPGKKAIACIHQLEMELGSFDRTVTLPAAIDINGVTSCFKNGILAITMPKKLTKKKIRITISDISAND